MNNFGGGPNMNMFSPAAGNYGSPFIRLRSLSDGTSSWDLSLSAEILIGRHLDCSVCLSDITVSRRHCRIFYRSEVYIENLSTTNVARHNDRKLNSPHPLYVGDSIKCGNVILLVEGLSIPSNNDLNNLTTFVNV